MNKIYAWFGIYNFEEDPEIITKRLGIKPSQVWKKGDKKPFGKKFINIHKNTWKINSDLKINETAEEHIKHLLEIVEPAGKHIKNLSKKCYIEFGLALYIKDYNPGIHLEKSLLERISKLNAELDLDFYFIKK